MRKVILTTGCDPSEPWTRVHALTFPRFRKYAERHGYDFVSAWYNGDNYQVDAARFPEFYSPDQFTEGARNYEVRKDFIRWSMNRRWLAPNWIRYAAIIQLLETYDVVMYLDGDVVIGDFETDAIAGVPEEKWLVAPLNGPSPDNAGPGGPLFIVKSCAEAKAFWTRVWQGRKWISHEWWTDGVDFMDALGYSIEPPIHKVRDTEYDRAFQILPSDWMVWFGANPGARGHFYHPGGGGGRADAKVGEIKRLIAEYGI